MVSPDVVYTDPTLIQPDPASLDHQGWLEPPTSHCWPNLGHFWTILGPNFDFNGAVGNPHWSVLMLSTQIQNRSNQIQPVYSTQTDWNNQLRDAYNLKKSRFWGYFWGISGHPWTPIYIFREQQKDQAGQSWCCPHRSSLDPTRSSQFRPSELIGTTS